MVKLFLYLHIVGLLLLAGGVYLLIFPSGETSVSTMTAISAAIGMGLLMISPYPVVKVIQWMKAQDQQS